MIIINLIFVYNMFSVELAQGLTMHKLKMVGGPKIAKRVPNPAQFCISLIYLSNMDQLDDDGDSIIGIYISSKKRKVHIKQGSAQNAICVVSSSPKILN